MAFSFVRSATNGASSGTTATITFASAAAEGELVVVYAHNNTNGAAISPSGTIGEAWSEVFDKGVPGETMRQALYWKVAGASEPSSYTFDWTGSSRWFVIGYIFSADSGTPALDAGPTQTVGSSGTSLAVTGITVATDALAFVFGGCDNTIPIFTAVDNSYTGPIGGPAGTGGQSAFAAYRIFTTGGATGTVNFTGANTDIWYGEHISFVEGGGGGGDPEGRLVGGKLINGGLLLGGVLT